MRRFLFWIWTLPWPGSTRRLLSRAAAARGVRTLLIPQFMIGVVGLIENERGELLVLHHTYRREYPWGLPTGFLEHGEQPEAALRREIAEETGLEVVVDSLRQVEMQDEDR